MNKISIFLLVSFITTTFYFLFLPPSYALSPFFIRQDIRDDSDDMILSPNFNLNKTLTINEKIVKDINYCNIFDSLTNTTLIPYGDITEVSYLSDGKFFNSTLWINDYLNFANPLFPEGMDIFMGEPQDNLGEESILRQKSSDYIRYQIERFTHDNLILDPKILTENNKIIVGGEQALISQVTTTRNDSSRSEETYLFIAVSHKHNIYYLTFSSLSHRYNYLLDDVNRILESFTFINNTNITNLDIFKDYYVHKNYKIAFAYPSNATIDGDFQGGIRISFPTNDINLVSKSYQILIDVKSTFDNGIDYIKKIWYDNSSKQWKDSLYEIKSMKKTRYGTEIENDGNLRSIDEKKFTEFPTILLNKQSRQNFYVPIIVDLSKVNFPNNYDIYFVTTSLYKTKNNHLCNIIDTTSFTPIPPPKINITINPESLEIRPGEEKSLEIRVDPSTRLPYKINLTSVPIDIINPEFTFYNNSTLNKELFITNLKINVSDKEDFKFPKYYSFPITATISIEPSHKDILTNYIIKNKLFANMTSTVYLPIKVNPPLHVEDYINYISERIFSPLGGILTTLGVIVAGIVGVGNWFLRHIKKGK